MKMPFYYLASIFLISIFHHAHAGNKIDRMVDSLCDYAKTDNRQALRKKIKHSKMKLRQVYQSVTCGSEGSFEGGSLLRTATYFNSFNVAKYLVLQIGKQGLNKIESDGKTVTSWAIDVKSKQPEQNPDIQKFIEFFQSKQ